MVPGPLGQAGLRALVCWEWASNAAAEQPPYEQPETPVRNGVLTGFLLGAVTLGDLQAFADGLQALAPATQARILSAVKSLLTFGHRLGLLPVNAGAPLRLPKLKSALAARILEEEAVQRLLALEPSPRNRALLRLTYGAGLRVSEVCALRWQDLQPRDAGAGQVSEYGKGGKTRTVLLSP